MATLPQTPVGQSRQGVQEICVLCGLPARAPVRSEPDDGAEGRLFCCSGCRNVWRILEESGQIQPGVDLRGLPLFQQALQMGLLGQRSAVEPKQEIAEETPADEKGSIDDVRQCILRIDGMWCSSCAWLIAEMLRRRRGVVSASVSFATDSARVSYKPARLGIEELRETIQSLGYTAEEGAAASQGSAERSKRQRRELIRVGIAFIFAMNVMMLTPVLYSGQFEGLTPPLAHILSWLLLVLSIPVLVCSWPLFDRAIRAARRGAATMETLVTVGASVALIYSVYAVAVGSARSYFDTADMLLALVLVGKYIESSIRAGATDAIGLLHGLMPKKAMALHADGRESAVTIAQLAEGDLIRVRAGESIAADGVVEQGAGSVDESLLTGEGRPVPKRMDDPVTGGSMLLDGAIDVRVARAPLNGGTLQQMAALVQESLHRKTRSEQMADRISRVFVPLVMALAVATAAWVYHETHHAAAAVTRAVAVLVIACPCALGIATPMAILAGVGAAARRGILIGDPEALETATRLKRVIFDKTGTLTEGRFRVRNVLPENADLTDLSILERLSEHSIARAIRAYADTAQIEQPQVLPFTGDRDTVTNFTQIEGSGICGDLPGRKLFAGNARMAELFSAEIPGEIARAAADWSAAGQTVVYYGEEKRLSGIVALGDSLRPHAQELVRALRESGIESEIVSGDAYETVAAVAQEAGVGQWRGSVLPAQKAELVAEQIAQMNGMGAVAMVGDGVNDAPALARADLGIAMSSGAEITGLAAGVTLMSSRIERIIDLIAIGRATNTVIRQNLFWALSYNLVCIPLAVAGWVTPIWAAAAMLVSSLTVVANTRRLAWKLGREEAVSKRTGT